MIAGAIFLIEEADCIFNHSILFFKEPQLRLKFH